jgi:hypothetical protein
MQFKEFFADLVRYGFPTMAMALSIISYHKSRKIGKLEEKLKKYDLEAKEKEREEGTKAYVEARIVKNSRSKYVMKVWNSGKATAHDVNFEIPPEYKNIIWSNKVPYEFLEPGKHFEEHVMVHSGTPDKLKITVTWKDEHGPKSREELLTI